MDPNLRDRKYWESLERTTLLLLRDPPDASNVGDALQLIRELQLMQIDLSQANADLHRDALELRHKHTHYRNLYNYAPVGYLTVDETGVVDEANLTAASLLRIDRARLAGQSLMSFVAPAGKDAYDDCWTAARVRDTHSADVEFRLGDQTHRLMRLELTHVDTVWLPAPWCVVFTDVTDRVRLESQLQEARKLRSLQRLAGGVARDFNDQLNVIIGSAAVALESLSSGARVRGPLEEIEGAAVRAVKINDQLLAYAGQTTIGVARIGVGETIRETEPLLHALAAGNVSIEFEPAGDLPPVMANKMQIQQVLLHLVANASESMRGGGAVCIRISAMTLTARDLATITHAEEAGPGRFVRIDVSDTGVGMTGHTRERMFEPFFTTRLEGRGLGLPAVLGIVHRHHGAIDVESRPNGGTRVSVLLPVAQDGAAGVETPAVAVDSSL